MYGAFKFHFVGRAGKDPEESVLANGRPRWSVSLVTNVPKKKPDGGYEEKAIWITVAFFGEAAKRKTLTFIRKGTVVYVEGDVMMRKAEIAGKNYTFYDFWPSVIRPLTTKSEQERIDASNASLPEKPPQAAPPSNGAAGQATSTDPFEPPSELDESEFFG